MKQRKYTELQTEIMKVLERLGCYLEGSKYGKQEIEKIKEDYGIKEPYLTLRQYIIKKGCGAYHTFHFSINGKEIVINTLSDFLTDECCHLYIETNKYYVVEDDNRDNGGDVESYHCDHYLTLEQKED